MTVARYGRGLVHSQAVMGTTIVDWPTIRSWFEPRSWWGPQAAHGPCWMAPIKPQNSPRPWRWPRIDRRGL